MPFVKRVVTPKYIARSSTSSSRTVALRGGGSGGYGPPATIPVADNEFEALTNITLSNALRQLASLVFISNQIFTELHQELSSVTERSAGLKQRIDRLSQKVEQFDPKQVTVPESDLDAFVQIKAHYKTQYHVDTGLFTVATRSETVQELYEAAAKTPVATIAEMDRIVGNEAGSSSEAFICTPILSRQRRAARANNVDMDIEVSLPTAVQDLRKWTSSEAIGDVTTGVACPVKIVSNGANKSVLRHTTDTSLLVSMGDYTDGAASTSNPATAAPNETDLDAITSIDESIVRDTSSNTSHTSSNSCVDHLLPSPAEQCRALASKFPAETIKIDTSGRVFDRMSCARRSLVCYTTTRTKKEDGKPEEDTVRRRSRLRRPRGKRRNTIAGTDQREIAEVISKGESGEGTATTGEQAQQKDQQQQQQPAQESPVDLGELLPAFRSRSSDLLRKEPASFSAEWTKSFNKMSHFNSLKQWGINRLRMMNRDSSASSSARDHQRDHDIDDFNIHETTLARQQSQQGRRKASDKEKRLSHDRKPSYSSSERSSSGVLSSSYLPASINPVKLRETSTVRRQRRTALGNRDEPHSSSGNWSASSESGRTSIGSEITTSNTHPKSSASSTSLNHSNPISSSAPPSSIVSRRRFFNTSASSSVTSEGTITPDLQTFDYHDEGGETSSVYSCDTEGYYTSFHVDSGLKTLKEEEPMTPLQSTTALSSITSFSSSGNTTIVSQENEYDLFGKGSTTSTTTSSAGTICTVLADASNLPKIPERKSSLTKLNRSNSTASNGTLERSYSSSTLGSTLDSTGTIKRNGVLIQKEVIKILRQQENNNRLDVADGNATATAKSNGTAVGGEVKRAPTAEPEQSESSDVECVERTERLKVKTTINTSRIPSMCIITPTNSDDEQQQQQQQRGASSAPTSKTNSKSVTDKSSGKRPSLTESISFELKKPKDFRKGSLLPLNSVFGRLKGALPHLKKSPTKEDCTAGQVTGRTEGDEEPGVGGEYVEIAKGRKTPNELTVRRNLATVLSGNLNEETEYVSLNELPCNIKCDSGTNFLLLDENTTKCGASPSQSLQKSALESSAGAAGGDASKAVSSTGSNNNNSISTTAAAAAAGALKGAARVKLDANGRVIFSSDSLKRRKGAHTTFAPGPCVKDVSSREGPPNSSSKQVLPSSSSSSSTKDDAVTKLNDPSGAGSSQLNRPPSTALPLSVRQPLKRPLVSPRYGTPNNRIVPIGINSTSGGGGVIEPPKKTTLVATILPNSAKQQQQQQQPVPPLREVRELSRMHSFAPYTPPDGGAPRSIGRTAASASPSDGGGASVTAAYYKGAHVNIQNGASYRAVSGPVKPPYPEGAHSLDRSSLRNWYPDKLTVERTGVGATHYVPPRTYQKPDYEPPRALMTPTGSSSFSSPRQLAGSPAMDNPAQDVSSLYAVPNKVKPTPLTLIGGRRSPLTAKPLMDRSLRMILAEQSGDLSPIKPCQTSNPFKTSTPSKEDELLLAAHHSQASHLQNKLLSSAVRSLGNSPVHSGRSTPREMLEPQQNGSRGRHSWASNSIEIPKTCSDRLGTPKTSLMDFKKLLLAHGTKSHSTPGSKMSAVEMLKKSKEAAAANPQRTGKEQQQQHSASPASSNMTILDMSASPKMYSFRRIAQQHGSGTYSGSPTKSGGGKGAASRSNWRFNSLRSGVISTAIPEANSEEDIVPIDTSSRPATGGTPEATKGGGSVEESISSFKENIFLKEDENNFMKGEVPRLAKSFAGFSTTDSTSARGRLVKDLSAKLLQGPRDQEVDQQETDDMRAKAAALETAL